MCVIDEGVFPAFPFPVSYSCLTSSSVCVCVCVYYILLVASISFGMKETNVCVCVCPCVCVCLMEGFFCLCVAAGEEGEEEGLGVTESITTEGGELPAVRMQKRTCSSDDTR
jgi:hypothetical protein